MLLSCYGGKAPATPLYILFVEVPCLLFCCCLSVCLSVCVLLGRVHETAGAACSLVLLSSILLDDRCQLSSQINAMERLLPHNLLALFAVPTKTVNGFSGSVTLNHNAHRVGESNWVVRRIGWQEEHLSFLDGEILELAVIHDLEEHVALVLIEPFLSLVDVVVCPGVGSSDSHDDKVAALDKVVVDGRLQLVSVFLDPFAKVDGQWEHGDGVGASVGADAGAGAGD